MNRGSCAYFGGGRSWSATALLKCDVPETVPGDTAGPSYNSQNDNQANISDATALVVQTLSQTSLVGPAVATTIKSTTLVNATTQKYNPVPIAGRSSVITTFAEASTSGNLYNPAIKTRHFPSQSLSFGLDLTDKSIRYPSNAENVNAPFILQPPPGFYKRSTSNVRWASKSENQKPRGNASISVPSSNYLISTNDSPLNHPKVSQTMPTSFASWQQFPGEGLMGNQNYASHVYSRPQLSSHAHSNVYDNSVFGSENPINRHSNPCVNVGSYFNNQPEQFRTVNDWFMPRPELPKFDGNPLNYTLFINGFEKHIESKISDNKLLLCYLIQHCENTVKEKIKHFSNKGDLGYQLAKARLEKEYGRPCIIADVCERKLKTAPFVKSNDPESLKRYAEQLEKAMITLYDINYLGSFDSLETMAQLANKLPFGLKRAWVKESVLIEN